MKSRFKTWSEWQKGIKVAKMGRRVLIYCNLNKITILDSPVRPWNSRETHTSFMVKLYFKEVLLKHAMSRQIERIPGFELLGARCLYRDRIYVVCQAAEVVNQETGEVDVKLTIFSDHLTHPIKVLKSEVKI